jgi:hypothetical protein
MCAPLHLGSLNFGTHDGPLALCPGFQPWSHDNDTVAQSIPLASSEPTGIPDLGLCTVFPALAPFRCSSL